MARCVECGSTKGHRMSCKLGNVLASRRQEPKLYTQTELDERVRAARREVWDAAWLLLHEVKMTAQFSARDKLVIQDDRKKILKAIEAARAAEGEG